MHFSLRTNLVLVMILKVFLKILIFSNLCSLVSDKFILVDELSPKALRNLKNCVLVNISLCGKSLPSSELPIKFHEIFKVASVTLFNPDFILLSSKLDKFKAKKNHDTFTVQSEKSNLVSFDSLTLISLEFLTLNNLWGRK